MEHVVFQHPERLWIAVAIALASCVLLWLGYRSSPLSAGRKALAMLCKAGALSVLALCVLDPQLTRQVPRRGANEVTVIVDNGAGLTISEKAGDLSRSAALKRALEQGGDGGWIDQLRELFRVRTLAVDQRLRSLADLGGLDFKGERSDFAGAVTSLRQRGAGNALAAVVLFTDGNATDAAAWKSAQPGVGAPVFPVVVGHSAPERDLSIQEVTVAQTAFEDSPVMLTVRVSGQGFAGRAVAACVVDGAGKLVASESQRLSKPRDEAVLRLRVTEARPGVSFYRVMVMDAELRTKLAKDAWKTASNEATLANNERSITVDRGSGPYRVLYVSGRPNWEYKFLRRALAGDNQVQLPSLIRIAKREPKFEWRGRSGETSNPLFRGFGSQDPEEALRYDQPVLVRFGTKDKNELSDGFPKAEEQFFAEYRAIILDDIEAEFFTQEQMNLIERFVSERGGAVLMLGGQESFQAGGWQHTPVGRMLPVYLDRLSAGPPLEGAQFQLTREGWLEPWTRLRVEQQDDESRIAQMVPFQAVNQVYSIKPGASILATVSDAGQGSRPALVVQRFGEGRVAALTIGDLWRWGMPEPKARDDLEKFWRQFTRWLVTDVPDRIQLQTHAGSGTGSDGVKLQVRVRDAAFRPQDDATVKLVIEEADGKKSESYAEPSLEEAGLFEAVFDPRAGGNYRATAVVQGIDKKELGSRSSGWSMNPLAEEFRNLAPNREGLSRIAAETGGQVLELSEVGRLPDLLRNLNVPLQQTLKEPLWHSPWIFALILSLLAAEWLLRRRSGWI